MLQFGYAAIGLPNTTSFAFNIIKTIVFLSTTNNKPDAHIHLVRVHRTSARQG